MPSVHYPKHFYYGPMSTADKNLLTGMQSGDIVYDTTLDRHEYWTGAAWAPYWAMAPAGTYTGLSDTPAAHTARAVPYTNATANALVADAQFYYNDTTKTLYVQNLHTNDHIFANGWRIIEDWDRGGLIILDQHGRRIKRIGPGYLRRFIDWIKGVMKNDRR